MFQPGRRGADAAAELAGGELELVLDFGEGEAFEVAELNGLGGERVEAAEAGECLADGYVLIADGWGGGGDWEVGRAAELAGSGGGWCHGGDCSGVSWRAGGRKNRKLRGNPVTRYQGES